MTKFDVCVVGGAGHAGLPLSIALADRGKRVCIYDSNKKSIEAIRNGQMPFMEEGAEKLLRKVIGTTLVTSDDPRSITASDDVVVVIGTPVDEHLSPDFSSLRRFFTSIMPHFRNDQTLILRSTVFPGITERIRRLVTNAGLSVHVAFCPERILEGKALEELSSLPSDRRGVQRNRHITGIRSLPSAHRRHSRHHPHRGGAHQTLRQYLALHPVRNGESVLHDRRGV